MKLLLIAVFTCLLFTNAKAQIEVKAEYIGSSHYKDINNEKTGGKGDARVLSGRAQLPIYLRMNENNRPFLWGIGLGASHTRFENKNIPKDLCPSEILNAQITLLHLRPISKKWSILAGIGVGFYTAHSKLSDITMKNVLGHGAGVVIWHLRDNLDIGAGLAINTSFGYPMAFPSFYVDWRLDGRYEVKVQMMDALDVSAGINLNKSFKLKVMASMSGAMALEKINGKDKMFSHQYVVAGLQPEFRLGKFSMPITAGISASRNAYYEDRTLKAVFKAMDREYDPHFSVAPYFSIALRYGF